jgi:hypothetical protein
LDASDLVVSFGSTMGIEASYWSKPSILLSRCIYEKSGSVYVPKSKEEVVSLISRAGELPPLDKTGACKAAFFWSRGGHSVRYFSGSRADGFQFKGFAIKQTYLHRFAYNISKIYEKYVVEKVFNFALRVIVGKGK